MDITTIIAGALMFTVVVMLLVMLILAARAKLVSSGDVKIEINGDPDKSITVPASPCLPPAVAAVPVRSANARYWMAAAPCYPLKRATSPWVRPRTTGVCLARSRSSRT